MATHSANKSSFSYQRRLRRRRCCVKVHVNGGWILWACVQPW